MRALFLDRDGIFNEVVWRDGKMSSPRSREEIQFNSEFQPAALTEIRKLGYLLILITNQPDIERGLVPKSFVDSLHQEYRDRFGLDAIYCCPFSDDTHPLKKPNPGMLRQAALEHSLSLSECFHLGDTERDIGAARLGGCRSVLWDRSYNQECVPDFRVRSLRELHKLLDEHTK